jgi:hypothetical protein
MRLHKVERDKVANPLVEFGGASEVGEKEREAGDLEALADVERVSPIEVG